MKINPVGKAVLIQKLSEETMSKGGIHLVAKEPQYTKAKVLAVGNSDEILCKVGDIVILGKEYNRIDMGEGLELINTNMVVATASDE